MKKLPLVNARKAVCHAHGVILAGAKGRSTSFRYGQEMTVEKIPSHFRHDRTPARFTPLQNSLLPADLSFAQLSTGEKGQAPKSFQLRLGAALA